MSFSLVLFFKYFRWSCLLLFLDENYCLFPKTLVCNKPTETSFISFPMPKASVAKTAPTKGTCGLHPASYVVGSGQGDSFRRMDSAQKRPESFQDKEVTAWATALFPPGTLEAMCDMAASRLGGVRKPRVSPDPRRALPEEEINTCFSSR